MQKEMKKPCPRCQEEGNDNSGDNLVYRESEGKYFCFAGHGWENSGENREETEQEEKTRIIKEKGFVLGGCKELEARNISLDTCIKYGYQIGKNCQIANFYDDAGNVAMQKIRYYNKQFAIIGDKAYTQKLYGQHLFTPNSNVFITITEGELDALSVAEVFGCKYPVVSLPTGSNSASNVLSKNLEYLQGFKYVVLAFDNDEPGRKATEECLPLFEPGKLRTVTWPTKDASDLLQQGKRREIVKCIYDAKEYMPEPVKTDDTLIKALSGYRRRDIDWPTDKMNKAFTKIQIPAVYTLAGKPKRGKTTLMRELIADRIEKKEHVAIVSLEETIPQIVLGVVSVITGQDLDKIRNRELTQQELDLCATITKYLVIYDHVTYGTDMASIAKTLPYMIRTYKCNVAVFDNITYAASAGMQDERKGIDQALILLRDSTIKYDYTIFNVAHMKRGDGFDGDELSVEQIFGSQGIERYSNYILGVNRDLGSPDNRVKNTLRVEVLSDRETGQDVGKFVNLFYNKQAGRLEDIGGPLV